MRPTMLFVFAFFVACASAPTTLQRGTLTRPPPARHRPGVGAPVHDPRAPHPSVEPGPRPTRVLPQTPETRREPGIWATESPRAAKLPDAPAKWPDPPHILGWPLPYPPTAGTADDRYYARKCAHYMALQASGLPLASPDSLTLDVAKCFAAKLYRACMGIESDAAKARKPDPYFDTHIANTRKEAERFENEACKGVDWNPDIDALFNGAVLKHKRVMRSVQ
jgi:hypothetical protein